MTRILSRRRCGALSIVAAALTPTVFVAAVASPIWERGGAFESCLEDRFKQWVDARAELIVNLDPKAGDVDDATVASWTVAALEACRVRSGGGDRQSEARFVTHMANWRNHIEAAVQSIRRRGGGPD